MRIQPRQLVVGAAIALLLAGCSKPAEQAAVETAPPAAAPEAVTPMVAAATDPNQIGTASIAVGWQNNALVFASAGEGFCVKGGGCQSGVVLNTGNVDLSSFPPGDVLITVALNDDAFNAGYRFPTDGYQAVALAIDPPGDPVAPTPVFGQANWPAGFLMPVVSSDQKSVSWTDLESDENAYEYSIGLNGPNGRVVMDPKITNGGGSGNK
ncbi:MAG: hypothetical protein OEY13_12105 [Gammaproteobacteria bacterium]|nr:hypothetical protein [Gammaproteobacteria bacterium]MDH4311949.1 hypothetical protein [Gammaproteobacteria bacterium]MDH5273804.1 hypothetical protein [Gammaproteobacteria bacterium]